ncbi:tetratricopeptide repeat protein [Microcoleus vaginatus PCC 9802]|uniref:tetratricopeptide repeat-containing S1 family peptidase n=1 Tax=Microcoleus vaginatus TaxID=119532 RepID=UPI00020D298A|nr:Tetratricopeptide TPR_1 repeat-containing protein [Microcoleus vaginatus FGP-2]UNU19245.1 tetratricopeptide repeat protein [Microcoleus vaginatus PCC 9802]
MNINFSRYDTLTTLLAGTTAALTIVISQPAIAKTPQEVASIAGPLTVQINSSLGDGSGVIIAKTGKTYTVLTVNHVVEKADVKYTVRTSKGKNYQATSVTRLQTADTDPDLAVVKFESPEEYPVATIADSDQAVIGTQIFVYGYPATGGLFGAEREPELSPGLVTSRPGNRPEGYTLRYQAVTWSGMSGGPVFDSEGRVIGLHGQGEFGFAQTSSGEVAPIKTGFNAAVPINTFIAKLVAAGINKSELKVDNTPPTSGPVSTANPQDAQAYYYYFRGLSLLDQGEALDAIAHFNRALAFKPKYTPELYFNIGNARTLYVALLDPALDSGRHPNPIEPYTLAIEANPGFADAYYNRALAYLVKQDKPKAIADFQKAAELYKQGGRTSAYQDALNRIKQLQEN